MPILPLAFMFLFVAPGMFALAIAAPPSRWGVKGPFLVAAALFLFLASILVPALSRGEVQASPVTLSAMALLFGGYLFGSAGWLVRWRGRQTAPRDYLQFALQAYVGSVLGGLVGGLVAVSWMAVAIKVLGLTP